MCLAYRPGYDGSDQCVLQHGVRGLGDVDPEEYPQKVSTIKPIDILCIKALMVIPPVPWYSVCPCN